MNGARPLGRVIQDEVKRPLTDELLFGRWPAGGTVAWTTGDEKLTFGYPRRRCLPSRASSTAKIFVRWTSCICRGAPSGALTVRP